MQDNIMGMIYKEIVCILTSDRSEEVTEAWNKLEDFSASDCNDINYSKLLKSVLKEPNIKNIEEVPPLLQWFTKFPLTNTASDPISDYVAQFLTASAPSFKEKPFLAEILTIMYENQKMYLPEHNNHKNLGQAIVKVLSWMYIPENSFDMKKFMDDLAKILSYFKYIFKFTKHGDINLSLLCFKTLLDIVLTSNRENFGYGLVIVLQLVDDQLWREHMQVPVSEVILLAKDEIKITNMLCLFCEWMAQTTAYDSHMRYLSMWLTLFFRRLIDLKKRRIVTSVAEAALPQIYYKCLTSHTFNTIDIEDNVIFLLLLEIGSLDLHHRIMKDTYRFFTSTRDVTTRPMEQKKVLNRLVECLTKLTTRYKQHIQDNDDCKICYPIVKVLFSYTPREINQTLSLNIPKESEEMEVSYPSTSTGVGRLASAKVGLLNLGNTCYMNSVLQALAMTRQFCHEVLLYKTANDLTDQTVLKNLQNLFALLKYSSRNALAPNEILHASRPSYFMPGQQQDSSEFLCHLLDVLYEQEKSALMPRSTSDHSISAKLKTEDKEMDIEEINGATVPILNNDDTSPNMTRWTTEENLSEGASLQRKTQSLADFTQGEELAQTQNGLSDSHSDSTDSGIQSVGGEDSSSSSASSATSPALSSYLVHRVFGGELKVIYQCLKCGNESHNTDRFRDLQLCFIDNLEADKTTTVQDLINVNYFSPETLTGDNKYRCDKCAELCDAQRIIKVLQAPVHLILTLKHFRYDSESRLRTKLRRRVHYDETIKLPVLEQDNEVYQLYAAVVHSGYSMDYGHYITYACDSQNRWYKFNDSYVTETTLDDFKRLEPPDTPYILFYKRCGNEPEGGEAPDKMALPASVQEYVERDRRRHEEERRNVRIPMGPITRYNPRNSWDRDKNDDSDGQPPPSSCRDSINLPTTKYCC